MTHRWKPISATLSAPDLKKLSFRMCVKITLSVAALNLATILNFISTKSYAAQPNYQPPDFAIQALTAGNSVDLIVEYEAGSIEAEVAAMRQTKGLKQDDAAILNVRQNRYQSFKQKIDQAVARPDIESVSDYSHLPMSVKRFRSAAALTAFLANANIKAVYEDKLLHPVLTESLPLINQPTVSAAGEQGAGTMVAVIDNGVDYTNAAFGSCTSPGVPAGCRVVVSKNFGSGTTDNSHGTNVSAIVVGVAPATKIAMLNAFSGTTASTSSVISAINWAIANYALYNIAAINMSLGDSSKNTSQCISGNAFYTPVTNANTTGINVVIASGNSAYSDGLANPACTPGAISVGAVYDSNIGGINWGSGLCTDATTVADKVACFSNSASYLTLLAPGALITAAGLTEGGTSQASPHVAGAVAVLRSTYTSETVGQIKSRLVTKGTPITDPRNGIITPRLDLLASARPANDPFENRVAISGTSGTQSEINVLASKQSGEPAHAQNSGGDSIWWKWTAPSNGQVSLDTHGSNFDTLLAVYSGSAVNALTEISSNDNDGSSNNNSGLLFQAHAGNEYEFAIDGKNAASGTAVLNWSLNTSAQANLSIVTNGPTSIPVDANSRYHIVVTNNGPQSATNVVVSVTLPANVSYVSSTTSCSVNASILTCNLGVLANGAIGSLDLVLLWANDATNVSLVTSVSSDLPDSSTANNQSSLAITSFASNDDDVPFLPNWAIMLLATLLLGTAILNQRA